MIRKQMLLLALTGALLCLLAGCGKEETPPTEYQVGSQTITALAPTEEATFSQEDSENAENSGEAESSGEAKDGETAPGVTSYTYEGLETPGATAEEYLQQLLTNDGFSVVDEAYQLAEAPDFTAAQGAVRVAKAAEEEGKLVILVLSWTEESCTVTVSEAEGQVVAPEEEAASEPEPEEEGFTIAEAVAYLCEFPPAALGLDGDSMEEYEVYALDGMILVNGTPCLQLNVYSNRNPEQTNQLAGMYLISSERQIYWLDKESQSVRKLV